MPRHISLRSGTPVTRRPRTTAARAAIVLVAVAGLLPLSLVRGNTVQASTTVFADGFESGAFAAWTSKVTSGDGSALVESSVVRTGTYAARLYGSTNSGSAAYLRKTLSSPQANLTASLDLDVTADGLVNSNVPILKLFSATGTRIVSLYRQNQTGGQVWVQDKASYVQTKGTIPLGAWSHVDLHVIPQGGSSTIEVRLNGTTVLSTTHANLGNDWVGVIQIGNAVGAQAFTEYVDNVSASSGATTSATASPTPAPSSSPTPAPASSATPAPTSSPTPAPTSSPTSVPTASPAPSASASSTPDPTASPTPTPAPTSSPTPAPTTSAGWVNVINDQFSTLSSVPSHWTLYDGPYGSGPRNCAIPSHDTVSGGALHLSMYYQSSGLCGAGWYTGGMKLTTYGSVDQRVTVQFRIVSNGVIGHYIIPMRWPATAAWPSGGEEDYCEGEALSSCSTFLHYGSQNYQIYHGYSVDLSQWHTLRFQRLNHVVSAYIDNLSTPVWTYSGSSTTLPDTIKNVVLQQECQSSACPSGTSGSEDIQIAWITVDNPV